MKKIFYNNNIAYVVLRKIKVHDCDPKRFGARVDNEHNRLKVLMAWRDHVGADHVLQVKNDTFYLCETIQDAKIIEK
tara:strand:- start:424 stop:654 length:231 start_codon:yes stop_codon:yes gene_type:complete